MLGASLVAIEQRARFHVLTILLVDIVILISQHSALVHLEKLLLLAFSLLRFQLAISVVIDALRAALEYSAATAHELYR